MDSDQAKLFVGGISWETTEHTLKDHFNKYGDVIECVIMRDRNTGNARGFGFVQFSDTSVAGKVLQDKHVILGRTVEVKKAVPRGGQHQHHQPHQQQNKGSSKNSSNGSSNNQFKTKKIFVGGLSASLTEEEFKNYFEKFGRITDVVVMYDSATQRPRGFGFITFDSEEAVESVMQKNFHELNDKLVEVKRAVPKDGNNSGNNNNYSRYNMRGGIHPLNSPGIFSGYAPQPLPGYGNVGGYSYGASTYGGGYPIGGYGGVGYGATPFAAPSSPWYGQGMFGARRSPVPYGSAIIYPSYINGGVGGVLSMAGGYHGIVGSAANGKWNQGSAGDAQMPAGTTTQQSDGGKDDPSGFDGSFGATTGKQNQRGPDGQFKPYPITNSS